MKYKTIGIVDIKKKNSMIIMCITRDQYGKFYVDVNGRSTQKKLNAEEIVRYLLNSLQS